MARLGAARRAVSSLALREPSFAPSQLVEKRLAVNRSSPQERLPPLVDPASENLGRGTIAARGYLVLNNSLELWSKRHTHGRHAALASGFDQNSPVYPIPPRITGLKVSSTVVYLKEGP
jgi:hypothetical protein